MMIAEHVHYREQTPSWVRWGGFSRIAFLTPDLETTIQFYEDIIGMRASQIFPATKTHGRHCVLSPGGHNLGVHFFENSEQYSYAFPDEAFLTTDSFPDTLQCIAFILPDERSAAAFQERLRSHGINIQEIRDQGSTCVITFFDNNGLQLKAAWSTIHSNR